MVTNEKMVDGVFYALGWVGATATSVNLLPQVVHSARMSCNMQQLSTGTLALNLVSGTATLMYAAYYGVYPIVFANAVCTLCALLLVVLKLVDCTRRYGSPRDGMDTDGGGR